MAAKMDTIVKDNTGPQQQHNPSCRAHHRLSTKGKLVSKNCNSTKTQGLFHCPFLNLNFVLSIEEFGTNI